MLLTLYNQYFENKFQERFIINEEKVNNFETLLIILIYLAIFVYFHKSQFYKQFLLILDTALLF